MSNPTESLLYGLQADITIDNKDGDGTSPFRFDFSGHLEITGYESAALQDPHFPSAEDVAAALRDAFNEAVASYKRS